MTKKEMKQRMSEILKAPAHECTGKEYDFALDVLKRHHDWSEKSKRQKVRIFTKPATYGTKCFWLVRQDGTATDISYLQALNGKPSNRQDIAKACRHAVKDVIEIARQKVKLGIDRCPYTNEVLTAGNLHIDHYNLKFAELVSYWIELHGEDRLLAEIDPGGDGQMEVKFASQSMANKFVKFHNSNTNLRAVSATANLKILK